MKIAPELLLLGAVIAVGILHTLVPDHWLPIAIVARQRHWMPARTAQAAAVAGLGHTASTLLIGIIVWFAGLALAIRFGNLVSRVSGIALVVFGLWMAIAAALEMRRSSGYRKSSDPRTALLLIVGSSPMLEGVPAFFAAGKFGVGLLTVMAVCFAISTIVTYVVLCVFSHAAFERVALGPLERYGEVFSGGVIAAVGLVFLFVLPA